MQMRKSARRYFEVSDRRRRVLCDLGSLARDTLFGPSGAVCLNVRPDELAGCNLCCAVGSRVTQPMNGIKHFSAHRVGYEWARETVRHIDYKFPIADVYAPKTQPRSGLVRYSLEICVKRLFYCHLVQVDLYILDCCYDMLKVLAAGFVDRFVDVRDRRCDLLCAFNYRICKSDSWVSVRAG